MIVKKWFTKRAVSIFILLLINFVFSYKYLERVIDYPMPVSVFLSILYFIILYFSFFPFPKFKIIAKYANVILLLLFSFTCFFVFSKVDVNSLNVDRWSIITNFWNAFFNGEYAYFSSSNVGNPPGPMPFYFLLALPFYWIGELGYFSLTGILFFYILLKYLKFSNLSIFFVLLFLTFSTFYAWEIVSRSNVLINSTLILFSIVFFERFQKYDIKKIILSSLIIGCLLSTRNIFAIAYIVYFMYLLLSKKIVFLQLLSITSLSIVIFALTFLPFVIGHFDSFFEMNPFLVQSTFLVPFGYTILFLVIAFLSSFFVKTIEDVIFCIGLNLFTSIAIYSIYLIIERGFYEAYFESVIDISYFIFCIPFFLVSLLLHSYKSLK